MFAPVSSNSSYLDKPPIIYAPFGYLSPWQQNPHTRASTRTHRNGLQAPSMAAPVYQKATSRVKSLTGSTLTPEMSTSIQALLSILSTDISPHEPHSLILRISSGQLLDEELVEVANTISGGIAAIGGPGFTTLGNTRAGLSYTSDETSGSSIKRSHCYALGNISPYSEDFSDNSGLVLERSQPTGTARENLVVDRKSNPEVEVMLGHQTSVHTWSHPAAPTLTNSGIMSELGWTRSSPKTTHDQLAQSAGGIQISNPDDPISTVQTSDNSRAGKDTEFWNFVALLCGDETARMIRDAVGDVVLSLDSLRDPWTPIDDANYVFQNGLVTLIPQLTPEQLPYDPATITTYPAIVEFPRGSLEVPISVMEAGLRPLKDGETVILETSDPVEKPLPHPLLLQVHVLASRIAALIAEAGTEIRTIGFSDLDEADEGPRPH